MTNEELNRLEELERKATKGAWAPLWRQDKDNAHAHTEFVGVPTSGNVLTGCNAIEVASRYVKKGEHKQASHDMTLIASLRNAAPALIAAARENIRLRAVVEAARDVLSQSEHEDTWRGDAMPKLDAALSALDAKGGA